MTDSHRPEGAVEAPPAAPLDGGPRVLPDALAPVASRLVSATDLPLTARMEMLEDVHAVLQDALSSLDGV